MATPKKKSKKSSLNRDNMCKFCKKGFSSEKTLSSHMCVKKRRFTDKDTPGARLGFRVFQRFYELTTQSKKPKAVMDFIDSTYYNDFVKFGRNLVEINPLAPDQFIDFVIKNGIKLKSWTAPYVYETFLSEYIKKEPAEKAVERTIVEMDAWATMHDTEFKYFFRDVSEVEATYLIKSGKISPWILYLADSSELLLSRLNEEQGAIISTAIDPTTWHKIFQRKIDDVKFVKDVISKAGL